MRASSVIDLISLGIFAGAVYAIALLGHGLGLS